MVLMALLSDYYVLFVCLDLKRLLDRCVVVETDCSLQMAESIAMEGLYFDEVSKLRLLSQERTDETQQLRDNARDFADRKNYNSIIARKDGRNLDTCSCRHGTISAGGWRIRQADGAASTAR